MAHRISRRVFATGALLLALGAPLVAAAPAAHAGPPTTPNSLSIAGPELPEPLTVRAEDDPELFAAVFGQVSWLKGHGQTSSPAAGDLGPKYTVVVFIEDVAKQTYDLYPLATGGPRAYRPTRQPDKRKTDAAWFYGRLTMPDTLRAAGVPLAAPVTTVINGGVGGIGGGARVIPDSALNPGKDIDRLFGDLRRVMLLNAAVVVTITMGLAGITLLVRRRTH
ncbi:hypothetical protein [Micromonospora sp. NPDC049679]|uniref:hypothetical protein n=1 Tax=Micromonospora sp. NPDC049679 TaxID=3155920 RepID=UPI0033F5427E